MLIRIISLVVLTCTLAGSVQYQHNPTSEVSADEKITNMTTNGSEQEDSEIQTEPDISSEETKERNLLTDALNTVLDPNSVIVNNEINNRFKSILDGIANANQTLGEFMDNMDKLSLEVCERSQDRLWSYVNDINNEEKKNDMMTDAGHEDEIKKQYWNILKSKYLHDPAIQADLDLKRKFRIIQERATNLQMPQSKQREEIDRMQRVWSRATVCAYNSTCGPDDTRSMSDIITIFKTTNQSKELIYYWKNFRDATGGKIRPIFKEYVNRINSIAKSENFTDAGAMWRFSFDDEDFTGTVNRLWGEVKPLYKLIHEYVKLKLKIYYKEEMNTKSDTIPAHLLGNLWAQEWQSIYPRVSPHPSHPHLDLSGESMSSRRLFDAVNDFHQSLGFQSSADSYSSVDDSPPTGAGCLPSSHDMCDGLTYRIKWCGDSSTQPVTALSRAARLLGHVQYFRHYSSLPPLYRDGPTPAFHDAISEMVAVQMTSPQHLKRLGFTDSELSPELFLNHLLWVALEKVPLMAFAFVLDKWRWNVFANTTQAWNQHWWDLRVGETGVSAPVLRNESDLDPAAKYHVVSHVQYITYLISHVLEFQIMLALCNSANYTGPLHQCSLYGAREAGSILSKGMALGASKNWRTVLRTLTGESEISTKGVLEYFRPLQDYLIKENIQLAQLDAEDDMDARAPVIVGVILVTLTGVIVTMYLVKKKGLGPKISRALGIVQNGSLDIVSSEMSAGKMNEVTATVVTGGHVAILDVALATGEQTSRKLNETFGAGSASFHHCDVTDEKVLTAACQQIIAKHKRVDVVINNAGILDDSPANYRRANDVNWQALVTMTVLAREHMRADRGGAGGTIVNISSVAALLRFPSLPIYSGAKAAVLHFSSCLGMEPSYSRSKVRVLSISFGPTYTPLMEHVDRKCMDQQLGKEYADMHNPDNYQSVESAVASMLTAVQRGQSGSAWLSIKNQPAKDISQHLHAAYAEIAKAFV